MSSYPYSTPSLPPNKTLADMVLFYASPALRDRLMMPWPEDAELLDDLVEEVIGLAETWRPSTEWHFLKVVRQGRTLEWMVWQVATSADEDLGPMYRGDAIIPWAIDLDTLPRYATPPTMLVRDDDLD
ncbi:MAG TPA: hypothetical protein VNQ73_16690 [Ilumatobacter sp.]|nr:hypothetical protein [Ilumatobacter sp.]